MRTNIDLDDKKIAHLMKMGNYKTKKEAVNDAIESQLRLLNNNRFLEMVESSKKPVWMGNLEEMRTYDKWEDNH